MSQKIKSIQFDVVYEGQGIVNYGHNDLSYALKDCENFYTQYDTYKNSNVLYAQSLFKKNPNANEEGGKKLVRTPITTSNCLRDMIFGDNTRGFSQSYLGNVTWEYILRCATLSGIVRGLMCVDKDNNMRSKPSAIFIPHALLMGGQVPVALLGSKGTRRVKGNTNDSTSMFYYETVGDTTWVAKGGIIDISKMQTLDDDELARHMTLLPEWIEGDNAPYAQVCQQLYGYIPYKVGHYARKSANNVADCYSLHGIKFDEDFIKKIIKETLRLIATSERTTAKGTLRATQVNVRLIGEKGFDTVQEFILTPDNVDEVLESLDFEVYDFYKEVSLEEYKKFRDMFLTANTEAAEKSDNKDKKKRSKKDTKENANTEE